MSNRRIDVDGRNLSKGREIPIGEIGIGQPIEQVSENDFVKVAELEEFMEQPILIMVHPSPVKGSSPIVIPSVNGVNQPIRRGVKTMVKRKYVEALARATDTDYEQETPDPNRPEAINMIERKVISYPFTVYDDPSPRGVAWLDSIMRSA